MNLEDYAKELSAEQKDIPQMILVYGDAFTGKTSLVCQLARKYKLIWIDCDNGYDVIFSALPKEFWKNITLVKLRDSDAAATAAKTLWTLFRSTGEVKISWETGIVNCPVTAKKGAEGKWVTINLSTLDTDYVVVVDSLTKLSDSAMQNYLGAPQNMDFKKKEFTHYDKQGLYLRNILNACQRHKCHFAFITHEEELEQEDGSKKLTPVCGTRNFSTQIGRYFSHCIHTSIKNKKHVVNSNTIGELKAISGSRSNVDVKSIDDFLQIFKRDFTKSGKELKVTAEATVASKAAKVEEVVEQSADLEGGESQETTAETNSEIQVTQQETQAEPAKLMSQTLAQRLASIKKS